MFKLDTKTNKIVITKGDNATFSISIVDAFDNEVQLAADDVITFTVRKNTSSQALITKTAENGMFSLIPTDTKTLSTGYYRYDIQLTTNDSKIYTIIPNSIFEIREEITI